MDIGLYTYHYAYRVQTENKQKDVCKNIQKIKELVTFDRYPSLRTESAINMPF